MKFYKKSILQLMLAMQGLLAVGISASQQSPVNKQSTSTATCNRVTFCSDQPSPAANSVVPGTSKVYNVCISYFFNLIDE